MLDESNFDQWLPMIEARVPQARKWRCSGYISGYGARRDAMKVMSYVKIRVLVRIPDSYQSDVRNLIQRLERTARPFQFLDLPPEIGTYIYEYVLVTREKIELFTVQTHRYPRVS